MKNIFFNKGIKHTLKKVIYTLLFVFIYSFIYNISYPGLIDFKSMGLSKIQLASVMMFVSVLGQNINTYIASGIIVNMLGLLVTPLERLKDKKDTRLLYEQIKLSITMFLSVVQSNVSIKFIEPYVNPLYKNTFFIYYVFINITMSFIAFWINRQMVLNGIGQGVTTIIAAQKINMLASKYSILEILKMPFVSVHVFCCFLFLVIVCISFESFKIKIPVKTLISTAYKTSNNKSFSYMEYKPINTNILSNVLANQTLGILGFFRTYFNDTSKISIHENEYLIKTSLFIFDVFPSIWYYVLILLFNYIYNAVYFSNIEKVSLNMRSNILYILNVAQGKKTENVIENTVIISSICSLLMTMILFALPKLFLYINSDIGTISSIDFLLVINSFIHIFKFFIATYIYHSYSFDVKLLSNIVY